MPIQYQYNAYKGTGGYKYIPPMSYNYPKIDYAAQSQKQLLQQQYMMDCAKQSQKNYETLQKQQELDNYRRGIGLTHSQMVERNKLWEEEEKKQKEKEKEDEENRIGMQKLREKWRLEDLQKRVSVPVSTKQSQQVYQPKPLPKPIIKPKSKPEPNSWSKAKKSIEDFDPLLDCCYKCSIL